MIASMIVDFSRIKVAIKVIRSAFTDEEVKQFNEVSGLIRGGTLDPGFKNIVPVSETSSRSEALDYTESRQYRTIPWNHDHFRHVSSFSSCDSVALLQKWEFDEVHCKQ